MQGKSQPVPPVSGRRLRECRWEPSASVKVPADWTRGVYLGRLTRPQHWTATVYAGPKGNLVFNASTIFWSQGPMLPWSHWSRPHGPDGHVQRITRNVLRRALGGD
jgi:hypothetical protein